MQSHARRSGGDFPATRKAANRGYQSLEAQLCGSGDANETSRNQESTFEIRLLLEIEWQANFSSPVATQDDPRMDNFSTSVHKSPIFNLINGRSAENHVQFQLANNIFAMSLEKLQAIGKAAYIFFDLLYFKIVRAVGNIARRTLNLPQSRITQDFQSSLSAIDQRKDCITNALIWMFQESRCGNFLGRDFKISVTRCRGKSGKYLRRKLSIIVGFFSWLRNVRLIQAE